MSTRAHYPIHSAVCFLSSLAPKNISSLKAACLKCLLAALCPLRTVRSTSQEPCKRVEGTEDCFQNVLAGFLPAGFDDWQIGGFMSPAHRALSFSCFHPTVRRSEWSLCSPHGSLGTEQRCTCSVCGDVVEIASEKESEGDAQNAGADKHDVSSVFLQSLVKRTDCWR